MGTQTILTLPLLTIANANLTERFTVASQACQLHTQG